MSRIDHRVRFAMGLGALVSLSVWGCASPKSAQGPVSPYPQPQSLAVVPFMNLSGAQGLNVMAATDEFITELGQVQGVTVMPTNRVLAALSELEMSHVESPTDVMTLAQALDVDAVIVGSITRWQPYPPPLVSVTVQLYSHDKTGQERSSGQFHVDPATLARQAAPFEIGLTPPIRPQAMVQGVYDASQDQVIERMKLYDRNRDQGQTPLSYRRHMLQRNYLRFVSHEVIGELFNQERERLLAKRD